MLIKPQRVVSLILTIFMIFSVMQINIAPAYTSEEVDTTPPEFAEGYPAQEGTEFHPGCKRVQMLVKPLEEPVKAYYVAVEHNAAPPISSQVMARKDSDNNDAIDYGYQDNIRLNGYIITSRQLPADDTVYDFWFVLEDAAGNVSEPKKVGLKAPIKILCQLGEKAD